MWDRSGLGCCKTPFSTGFSRQEYWSGLPFASPGDLPNPEIKPVVSFISCIGRCILYHWASWEATLVNKSRKSENWTFQGKSTGCQSQAFVKMENSISVVCVGYILFVIFFFSSSGFFLLSPLLYVFIIKWRWETYNLWDFRPVVPKIIEMETGGGWARRWTRWARRRAGSLDRASLCCTSPPLPPRPSWPL